MPPAEDNTDGYDRVAFRRSLINRNIPSIWGRVRWGRLVTGAVGGIAGAWAGGLLGWVRGSVEAITNITDGAASWYGTFISAALPTGWLPKAAASTTSALPSGIAGFLVAIVVGGLSLYLVAAAMEAIF